jgi:hypothetical protein
MKFNLFLFAKIVLVCLVAVQIGCKSGEDKQANANKEPSQKGPAKKEWFTQTTADGSMKVSFPVKPKLISKTQKSPVGDLKIDVIQCKQKDAAFTANATTLPVNPADYDANAGLRGAVDMQKKGGNEFISEKDINKNGLPGKEIVLKNAQGLYIKARSFIDGSVPRIYQVNVVSINKADIESEDATKFLDSIEFATAK